MSRRRRRRTWTMPASDRCRWKLCACMYLSIEHVFWANRKRAWASERAWEREIEIRGICGCFRVFRACIVCNFGKGALDLIRYILIYYWTFSCLMFFLLLFCFVIAMNFCIFPVYLHNTDDSEQWMLCCAWKVQQMIMVALNCINGAWLPRIKERRKKTTHSIHTRYTPKQPFESSHIFYLKCFGLICAQRADH